MSSGCDARQVAKRHRGPLQHSTWASKVCSRQSGCRQASRGRPARALEAYAAGAWAPCIAKSVWHSDCYAAPIHQAAVAAGLSEDEIAAAEARGRAAGWEAMRAALAPEIEG